MSFFVFISYTCLPIFLSFPIFSRVHFFVIYAPRHYFVGLVCRWLFAKTSVLLTFCSDCLTVYRFAFLCWWSYKFCFRNRPRNYFWLVMMSINQVYVHLLHLGISFRFSVTSMQYSFNIPLCMSRVPTYGRICTTQSELCGNISSHTSDKPIVNEFSV